jgi:hypothetical protein
VFGDAEAGAQWLAREIVRGSVPWTSAQLLRTVREIADL